MVPPPVGDAHKYIHCKPAPCRGAWTSSSSRIAFQDSEEKKEAEHQLLNPLHISRICCLSLHQVRFGHQVRSTDHTSRKFYLIIMKHVMALGHLYLLPNDKVYIDFMFIPVTCCRPDLAIIP